MKFGKRAVVRIISFAVAVVLSVVTLTLVTNKKLTDYKTQIGYGYSMNLSELDGSLYNISIALQKSLYASSPTQLSTIAVEICTESTVAKNALSQLPYSGDGLDKVNKFLSQVGDYTIYLSRKVIQGGEIEDDDRENLHKLSKTAQSISSSVNEVKLEYDEQGVWDKEFVEGINASAEGSFFENLDGLEELLADYPTLQYDGPFSDHLLKGDMKLLNGQKALSSEEALKKAVEILGLDVSGIEKKGDTDGNVPCYNFTDEEMSFSVTKQGGYIIYMRKFREIKEQTIEYEDAVKKAKEYLEKNSKQSFVSTYYFADEGVCTVSFAYKEGATVCYPDLIKIGVALDNGEIVSIEAGGYIANHYTRTISTPKYSVDEARQRLSKALKINDVSRCIIPTNGKYEKHCYEFDCTGIDGEQLLVYVNTQNLEEEQILLLLKTDGGTLTK